MHFELRQRGLHHAQPALRTFRVGAYDDDFHHVYLPFHLKKRLNADASTTLARHARVDWPPYAPCSSPPTAPRHLFAHRAAPLNQTESHSRLPATRCLWPPRALSPMNPLSPPSHHRHRHRLEPPA